jgi:hypothetical protein
MATKKQSEPMRTAPSIGAEKGIELLHKQIEAGQKLLTKQPLDRALLDGWYHTTKHVIDKAFGENSPPRHTFDTSDHGCMNAEGETARPRARQNVVFEFGYFLGLLGPKRVCAVLESGINGTDPRRSAPHKERQKHQNAIEAVEDLGTHLISSFLQYAAHKRFPNVCL